MSNRRDFIRQTGAAALAGILLSNKAMAAAFGPEISRPLGLQLFTFFGVIDDHVDETLSKIAAIGYKEIESAYSLHGGYYGMKPKEFNAFLKTKGLAWKSHHVIGAPFHLPPGSKMPTMPDGKPMVLPPLRNLRDNMQELVDEVAEGGVEWLVCANIPIGNRDEIKAAIPVLNRAGEACKKAGVHFAYHNHDAEFHDVEGKTAYSLFLTETDPALVKMELDLAWSIKGGADPVELFKANRAFSALACKGPGCRSSNYLTRRKRHDRFQKNFRCS